MLYMNEYDIRRAKACAEYEDWPVTLDAIATLERLVEWTDEHSDGWAYWPAPVRAARQLMERIQEQERKTWSSMPGSDMTFDQRNAALRPIKSFITRQISGGGADERDRRFILDGIR